ncbi:uncharacterized protein [Coffea arabica]|uniref:RNase H type-1 domain-containing protein n=1 Tax=Coffea arabica TaxID=13443 RepID=A0ABM4U0P4_COFAR
MGWLKLNSRDHWGRVVWAYYKEFEDLDVLTAEAQSLLVGLKLCADRGVSSAIMESDSNVLVHLVVSKVLSKWPLYNVLREIRHYLSRMEATLLHVFREANAVADTLASLQLGEQQFYDSLTTLPPEARGRACLDCHGIPRVHLGNV